MLKIAIEKVKGGYSIYLNDSTVPAGVASTPKGAAKRAQEVIMDALESEKKPQAQ